MKMDGLDRIAGPSGSYGTIKAAAAFRPVIERPLAPHGNAADEEKRFPPAPRPCAPGRRAEPLPWTGPSPGRESARERPRRLSGLSLAGQQAQPALAGGRQMDGAAWEITASSRSMPRSGKVRT